MPRPHPREGNQNQNADSAVSEKDPQTSPHLGPGEPHMLLAVTSGPPTKGRSPLLPGGQDKGGLLVTVTYG